PRRTDRRAARRATRDRRAALDRRAAAGAALAGLERLLDAAAIRRLPRRHTGCHDDEHQLRRPRRPERRTTHLEGRGDRFARTAGTVDDPQTAGRRRAAGPAAAGLRQAQRGRAGQLHGQRHGALGCAARVAGLRRRACRQRAERDTRLRERGALHRRRHRHRRRAGQRGAARGRDDLVSVLLRAGGRSHDLGGPPWLMGIVNATPDSFSDAGVHPTLESRFALARELIAAGAAVIDIGGESGTTNRPPVEAGEEIERVVPLIERVVAEGGVLVSIDTYKPAVAQAAIAAGATIVNDVSGLRDPELADVCAQTGAALVVMHTRAPPKQRLQDPDL